MAHILVVDDNAINRKLIVSTLSYEGHSVTEAADGVEGLKAARSLQPQLIISDILMPLMDGYEFVRHLRQDEALKNTPVIFHSAHYLEPEAQNLAARCQITSVLPRPCESAQLLGAVNDALTEATAASSVTSTFSGEHLRILTNKLAQKVEELQAEVEDRKKAQERVQHLNRVHAVLSGINALIVRVAAREELCWEACRLAIHAGHFQMAWIALYDSTVGRIVPFAWAGGNEDIQRIAEVSAAGSPQRDDIVSQSIDLGEPVVCNDFGHSACTIVCHDELIGQGYRAAVVLPLMIKAHVTGYLVLISEVAGFFDDEEMHLLGELAKNISFALDHIQSADKLDYLAYYDAITGLANRTLFEDRLTQYIEAATRRESILALVIIHIDGLDAVNDSFGRDVGDALLQAAVQRLTASVGSGNDMARIGTYQLAAVINDPRSDGAVVGAVERWWREWLGAPFIVEGHELTIDVKAGIALFPSDARDGHALIRNAEVALNEARKSLERHTFYTQNLTEAWAEGLAFNSKLKRALDQDQFVLHYQPKVDLETRRLNGVEALIRWQSPDFGLVPPVKFIPLLEENGLISEVGAWVFRQASLDRSRWLERRLNAPRIAVNVSTVQVGRDDFVRTVANILKLAGSEAGIDVEVTESLIMTNVEANIEKLNQLRQLGVEIAIDDFGTGYSSLAYLAKLPVQSLKIDRSFVIAMLDDPSAMTLVSTIISLAHALKMDVVAEGVESEEQAKILRLLRCDQMQGYLISKPLPFDDMTTYLSRSR